MPNVRASFNYSLDNGRPIDYYFYEPDESVELNPPGTDIQEMEINDGWPHLDSFELDKQGFALRPIDNSFQSFDDEDEIKSVFYPQVIEFVKKHTGAKRVEIFDHTIRKGLPTDSTKQVETQRPAVMLVHSDYTPKSGAQRVRDVLPDEADELLKSRVAFFNVWKSLYEVVEELPLACCDAQSQVDEDLLLMNLRYRDRTGEIYVLRHSDNHKWWYFPKMAPDEALLLKTYDSETDGRARFMGHSAFEDPTTPPDAPKRQSIELRTMAFF